MGNILGRSQYYDKRALKGLQLKDLNDPDLRPDTVLSGVNAAPAVGSTFIDPASKFALPSVNPIALVPNIVRYGQGGFVVHNQSRDPRGDIDYLIPVKMPSQQAEGINIGALLDRRHIPFITAKTPAIADTQQSVVGAVQTDRYMPGRQNENQNFDDIDREDNQSGLPGTQIKVSEPTYPEDVRETPGYVSTDVGEYEI